MTILTANWLKFIWSIQTSNCDCFNELQSKFKFNDFHNSTIYVHQTSVNVNRIFGIMNRSLIKKRRNNHIKKMKLKIRSSQSWVCFFKMVDGFATFTFIGLLIIACRQYFVCFFMIYDYAETTLASIVKWIW